MSKPAIMRKVWDRRFDLRVQCFRLVCQKSAGGCWPIFQGVTIKANHSYCFDFWEGAVSVDVVSR